MMKKFLLGVCLALFASSYAFCTVTLDFKIDGSTSYAMPMPNGSGSISGTVALTKTLKESVETGVLTVYIKRADGTEFPVTTSGFTTIAYDTWQTVGGQDQISPVSISFGMTPSDLNNVSGKVYVKFVQNGSGASAKSNDITVTVPIFNNNLIDPAQNSFAGSGDPGEITGTTPSGGNGTFTYKWEIKASPTGTFAAVTPPATGISYNPPPITTTTSYRRVAMSAGLSNTSGAVQITITAASIGNNIITNPGAVSYGNGGGDPATLTGTVPTGGAGPYTYQWQSATSAAPGTFTDIIGETGQNYNPPQIYYTMYYRRRVSSNGVGPSNSNTLVISVYPSGKTMADPIDCGNLDMCGRYGNSLVMSPAYAWGNEWGGPADDIFYKFNLTVAATVSLYNCKPDGVSGTLTLLNAAGTIVSGGGPTPDECDVGGGYAYSVQPGIYYVVNEGPGGTYPVNMPISIYTTPLLSVSPDVTIQAGGSTTLAASGNGTSYSWSPSTGLNTTTGASVIATPAVTTTYTVWAVGPGGCSQSRTVLVTVRSSLGKASREATAPIKGTSNDPTETVAETTAAPQSENPGNVNTLYPNPASHAVTFTLEQNAPAVIYIMNLNGIVVKEVATTGTSANLNVNDLPAGIYPVKIVQQNTVRRAKLVIER